LANGRVEWSEVESQPELPKVTVEPCWSTSNRKSSQIKIN